MRTHLDSYGKDNGKRVRVVKDNVVGYPHWAVGLVREDQQTHLPVGAEGTLISVGGIPGSPSGWACLVKFDDSGELVVGHSCGQLAVS